MLRYILIRDSFFIEEGKNLPFQEFGKEYELYFSILELIAPGRTSHPETVSVLNKGVGGHPLRLEETYDIVRKVIDRDISGFSGYVLERLFIAPLTGF